MSDTLESGQYLSVGQFLESGNRAFRLNYQEDGNLVIYTWEGIPIWSAGISNSNPYDLVMQEDGNLVIYDKDGMYYWSSETRGQNHLVMQNDGNAVIYNKDGIPVWASHSVQDSITLPPELEIPIPLHPDPVIGQIGIDDLSFKDTSGRRPFILYHAGDIVARRFAGADIRPDLDILAREGYHIIRPFGQLRPNVYPWNQGGDPLYNGLDAFAPDFIENWIAYANEVYERGMRTTILSGGFDKINSSQELQMMQITRQIIDGAGHDRFAWTEPMNEPSSVHATSDDNGDNTPEYLEEMSRIMTPPDVLWHLGHVSNIDFNSSNRFSQKRYTRGPIGCQHPYRHDHFWDKMRHWFSWIYEEPGQYKRLWVYQETVGQPANGQVLRYVSDTHNASELDAEALALLWTLPCIRGVGGAMSGTGVQKYEEYDRIVGFSEFPWLASKLPRDVQTFNEIHHSGDSKSTQRTIKAKGNVRIDGVTNSDGRIAQFIYGPPTSDTFEFTKDFRGTIYNPKDKTEESVDIKAGQARRFDFQKGRMLISS